MTNCLNFQIKFYWRSPLPSECALYNSELAGFHYILKGLSPWIKDQEIESEQSSNTSVEFVVPILDNTLKPIVVVDLWFLRIRYLMGYLTGF